MFWFYSRSFVRDRDDLFLTHRQESWPQFHFQWCLLAMPESHSYQNHCHDAAKENIKHRNDLFDSKTLKFFSEWRKYSKKCFLWLYPTLFELQIIVKEHFIANAEQQERKNYNSNCLIERIKFALQWTFTSKILERRKCLTSLEGPK